MAFVFITRLVSVNKIQALFRVIFFIQCVIYTTIYGSYNVGEVVVALPYKGSDVMLNASSVMRVRYAAISLVLSECHYLDSVRKVLFRHPEDDPVFHFAKPDRHGKVVSREHRLSGTCYCREKSPNIAPGNMHLTT